jgi:hypothetical protein
MNIGQFELSLKRRKKESKKQASLARKARKSRSDKVPKQQTGKVDNYREINSKTFGTYKSSQGDSSITYDIVEGLYKRTIMRRVINKLAGDCSRLKFRFIYTDYDGKPHKKAMEVGKEIDKLFMGYHNKQMYRDMDVYGDAFLYKQIGTNDRGKTPINIQDIYGINPRTLDPVDDNGMLKGWQYQGSQGTVELSPEEVIHIPNDPLTGDLFGISIFESVMQVLTLILNSQLNSAIILDHYALPLVHWQIDAKHERRKTPLSEILKFIENLKTTRVGNDLVTDSSVKHEIIGVHDKLVDFTPMLNKLDAYLFATAGVPGQILGMPADNLSAITRQLQSYYENVFDKQRNAADYFIEQVYWPEILAAGIDDVYSIDYIHAKPLVEQESRIATWVEKMLQADIIDRQEGRAAIGYQGPPPAESNNYRISQGAAAGPELDKNNNNPEPKGTNKK